MEGSDVVLKWFLVSFSDAKLAKIMHARFHFVGKVNTTLRGRTNFKVRPLQHATTFEKRSMNSCMLFEASILN